MVMTGIYLAIVAVVLALAAWCLLTERTLRGQLNAALVVIPLLLRLLLIK
jgi:hypothetical protein